MAQPVSGYLYDSNLKEIKASSTVSGSADTSDVDITNFNAGNGITLIFHCSAVAGAGSLAIQVQESATNGGTASDITGATITVDEAGLQTLFIPNVSKPFIQLEQTLTGTSVTYSCVAYGQPGHATTSEGFTVSPAA